MLLFSALVGAFLATSKLTHMQLYYPPPFNASNNPHRTTSADPYLQYPYDCCGPNDRWEYPCRGYISLLGTPQGAPTATWEAGSVQDWNITGIGNHYGGSCQVGFSTDKGETFRVARSYEGNCPHRNGGLGPGGQNFNFTVPEDLEAGVQVFAWVWYNREQEFNMNCAAVNITRPTSASGNSSRSTSTTTTTRTMFTTLATITKTKSFSESPADSSSAHLDTISTTESLTKLSTLSETRSASPAATSVTTLYLTANDCSCMCESPANITSCTCWCNSTSGDSAQAGSRNLLQATGDEVASSASFHVRRSSDEALSINNRPVMFIADDSNGCLTPKSTAELRYPHPGPDVCPGDGVYPLELPKGNCEGPGKQEYHGSIGNDGHS